MSKYNYEFKKKIVLEYLNGSDIHGKNGLEESSQLFQI